MQNCYEKRVKQMRLRRSLTKHDNVYPRHVARYGYRCQDLISMVVNSGGGGGSKKKDEYLEKQIHVVKTALCSFDVLQQRVNYGKRKRSERTL
jgi:hypothetical protein